MAQQNEQQPPIFPVAEAPRQTAGLQQIGHTGVPPQTAQPAAQAGHPQHSRPQQGQRAWPQAQNRPQTRAAQGASSAVRPPQNPATGVLPTAWPQQNPATGALPGLRPQPGPATGALPTARPQQNPATGALPGLRSQPGPATGALPTARPQQSPATGAMPGPATGALPATRAQQNPAAGQQAGAAQYARQQRRPRSQPGTAAQPNPLGAQGQTGALGRPAGTTFAERPLSPAGQVPSTRQLPPADAPHGGVPYGTAAPTHSAPRRNKQPFPVPQRTLQHSSGHTGSFPRQVGGMQGQVLPGYVPAAAGRSPQPPWTGPGKPFEPAGQRPLQQIPAVQEMAGTQNLPHQDEGQLMKEIFGMLDKQGINSPQKQGVPLREEMQQQNWPQQTAATGEEEAGQTARNWGEEIIQQQAAYNEGLLEQRLPVEQPDFFGNPQPQQSAPASYQPRHSLFSQEQARQEEAAAWAEPADMQDEAVTMLEYDGPDFEKEATNYEAAPEGWGQPAGGRYRKRAAATVHGQPDLFEDDTQQEEPSNWGQPIQFGYEEDEEEADGWGQPAGSVYQDDGEELRRPVRRRKRRSGGFVLGVILLVILVLLFAGLLVYMLLYQRDNLFPSLALGSRLPWPIGLPGFSPGIG